MKKNIIKCFNESKYYSIKDKSYFPIYEDLLSKFRNKKVVLVEVGVSGGGSLFMWKNFLGKKAKVIGIDANPECKYFEKYGFNIEIGDQASESFWKNFYKKYKNIDILIDDGGHRNDQQIITTLQSAKYINNSGLIIVEDVGTSYMKKFGNPSKYSFMNYSKKIIDDLFVKFSLVSKRNYSLSKYVYSIKFYGAVVCFEIDKNLVKKRGPIDNKKRHLNFKDYRNFDAKKNIIKRIKTFFHIKNSSSIKYLEKYFT